ncbi:MAG: hypothetical protein OER21_01280 [Gemmatimonadota bacterium]|nr:hypothetical protein [Gemmatimonadota bacterium]
MADKDPPVRTTARVGRAPMLTLTLQRVERTTGRFVDDAGGEIAVPLARLPGDRAWGAGDVIRVPLDEAQRPRWTAAALDEAETARRRPTPPPP